MNKRRMCLLIGFVALSSLAAPGCGHATGESRETRHEQSLYDNFKAVVERSNLSLRQHRSYTEEYVTERAQLFCGLMSNGDITKLTQEISFPPIVWSESPKDRPRLETAILMAGTPAMCPSNQHIMEQWLQTYMR